MRVRAHTLLTFPFAFPFSLSYLYLPHTHDHPPFTPKELVSTLMDHPSSGPIWSDETASLNPDQDESESTEDDEEEKEEEGEKRSVSQLGSNPPRKKRITGFIGVNVRAQPPPKCQVQKCPEDLTGLKQYYRRHKICVYHAKATFVIVAGLRQRFCQQCSRFHELHEFDDKKRSCRRRLAGHNERRRKSSLGNDDPQHSSRRLCIQLKENQFIHEGERGRG